MTSFETLEILTVSMLSLNCGHLAVGRDRVLDASPYLLFVTCVYIVDTSRASPHGCDTTIYQPAQQTHDFNVLFMWGHSDMCVTLNISMNCPVWLSRRCCAHLTLLFSCKSADTPQSLLASYQQAGASMQEAVKS